MKTCKDKHSPKWDKWHASDGKEMKAQKCITLGVIIAQY